MLTDGLPRPSEIAKALETPDRVLAGDVAFRLYDTFGIPYDFIEDTATTRDVRVDKAGYDLAMEVQRDKARAVSAFGVGKKGEEFDAGADDRLQGAGDQFEGYTATRVAGVPVLALFDDRRQPVDTLAAGTTG